MADPFLGQIMMVGFNFAPQGWAQCDGALLSIAQNSALFSLFGTMYGGDGRTTFGLPELRGRMPMHKGSGPGLTPRIQGSKSGNEDTFLNIGNIPPHNHSVTPPCNAELSTTDDPDNAFQGVFGQEAFNTTSNSTMATFSSGNTGNGQGFSNLPPFQVINFIVAMTGIYPSRP